MYRVQELSNVLEKRFDKHLKQEFGLSYSQYKVLSVIGVKSGCSQKTIADMLGQTEASISRQAKLLLKSGFVANDHSNSLRTKTLLITENGQRMLEDATIFLEDIQVQLTGSLAYQEQKLLLEVIDRMINKLTI